MRKSRATVIAATGIFLLALVLRLAYVNTFEIETPLRADAGKYFTLAANLAVHGDYSLGKEGPLQPANYITPGYPLFLAAFMTVSESFDTFYRLVLNIQALLGAVTVLLMFLLGLRMGGPSVGLVAAGLVAISPHQVIASGYLLTEVLFTFLLALSAWLALRAVDGRHWRGFALAGAVMGLAALVRPVALLVPFLLPFVLARSESLRSTASRTVITLLAMACVWAPWHAWKSANPAQGEPSSVAAALGLGGYPDLIHKSPALRGFPYWEDPEFDAGSVGAAARLILKRAKAEPSRYLYWYLLGKPVTYWGTSIIAGYGGPYIYRIASSIYSKNPTALWTLQFMMLAHPLLVIGGAMTCLWVFGRHMFGTRSDADLAAIWFAVLLVLYFTLVHSILAPLPRYAYPVHPFAYLLAVSGLGAIFRWAINRRETSKEPK